MKSVKDTKKMPPKSWEATKAELAKILTEAAGSVTTAPKSTRGLIQINHLNQWIDRRRLPAYAKALRRVCEVRWDYLGRYPTQVFEAELRAVGGDEAIALAMLGVMYHDDRGDGLLYVPAFRSRGRLAAWQAAAAAAGVKASKVRAA